MNKKRSKWRRWLMIDLAIILVITGFFGAYGFHFYHSIASASKDIHVSIDRTKSDKRVSSVRFKEQDPFTVLLLGVDERESDRGRSDTLILATVNPKTETTSLLSIPRDTYTEIVGHGTFDKINHAYAFGGIEMAIDTVENLLNVPIDYFVKVNMEGFEDIVDAVGGITVENAFSFSSNGYMFEQGQINLNGKQALAYARMRYEDPAGDFGRQERQKQVIENIIKEGATVTTLWNYNEILQALGTNLKTNLTIPHIIQIQSDYKPALNHMTKRSIEGGEDTYIDGIYYYKVPEERIRELQGELRGELGL
ncbi:membrane-bound transcriptional regulator LytR [Jeotgalibacillus alimentarius]|uniref:Polyisoprenyl-teichoic acid--peptidoglycan teichoic acid transferase TagU n=1 Tax=Jeotgalibacillus alimentarius TaxID=135826 RepID=A0A0C2VCI0_9BACL|nr:LCP family protein [Jeotgalibacillus alimentarius]KIL46642.1 membrane-bound transcriptional regulator LytR [Jeotgalibacillus alimentarius]